LGASRGERVDVIEQPRDTSEPVASVPARPHWFARWWTALGADSLLVLALGVAILTFVDLHALTDRALDYSDLTVPFLRGSALAQLSAPNPWYSLFVHGAYLLLPGGYGAVLNVVDVYSFALAPATMLVLLRALGVSRLPRLAGAMFYLANPVVLAQAAPGFFSWSLFFIFAPLVLGAFVVYEQTNAFRWLVVGLLLVVVLLQLDPFDGLRLIAPLLVGALAVPWFTRRVKSAIRMGLDYVAGLSIFGALVAIGLYPSVARLGYDFSAGSASSSAFYAFHIANVKFTYHAQDLPNSLSGLTLYPTGPLAHLGYADTAVWAMWFAVILAALAAAVLTCLFEGRLSPSPHRATLLAYLGTVAVLVGLQAGISSGALLGIFRPAPFLFDYEYPTIFNYVQIVLYAVFFALLVEGVGKVVRALRPEAVTRASRFSFASGNYILITGRSSRPPLGASRPDGGARLRRWCVVLATVGATTLVLVAVNLPIVTGGPDNPQNPTTSAASFLPAYYSQLGAFFSSQPGSYRVLPLPLNYSTIIWLESALPLNRVFGIPYAGLNSPGTYPNFTVLLTAMQAVLSNDSSSLAQLLAQDNVRYVVVAAPVASGPLKLASTNYNAYLTGGTKQFLEIFDAAPGFTSALQEANFTVFSDALYSTPVDLPPSVFAYNTSLGPNLGPPPPPKELVTDSNMSTSGPWTTWTSCAGPKANYITFGALAVALRTCVGADATGSSTHTPQTELYQRIAVFPGERLSAEVNFTDPSVGDPSLIVIFHNATNTGNFYSSQQYFPTVTDLDAAHFFYNVTAPVAATFAYVGLQAFNSSSSTANVSLNGLNVFNQFVLSNVSAYTDVPVVQAGSVLVPNAGAILPLARYFHTLVESSPSTTLAPMDISDILGDTPAGIVFLPAGSWSFVLPCDPGGSLQVFADTQLLGGNASLNGSEGGRALSSAGWTEIADSCSGLSYSVNVTVSAGGTVALPELFALYGPAAGSPAADLTATADGPATYRVSASTPGLAVIYSAEVATLHPQGGAQALASLPLEGGTLFVVNVTGESAVVVVFPELEPQNAVTVLSNVVALWVAVAGLAVFLSRRLYGRVLRAVPRVLRGQQG
jgi:hypothetical protein